MKKILSLTISLLLLKSTYTVEMVSVTNNFSPYPKVCKSAAEDEFIFHDFRRNRIFRGDVETASYQDGIFLANQIINNYPHLLKDINKICREDEIGYPFSYTYSFIGKISPTVLRYIKILGDLEKEFGNLKDFNIIEIGGGFGGQCKIINDLNGFKKYTIIDIPEALPLINKYLNIFSIKNVHTINYKSLTTNLTCDLLISNYAFSEIEKSGQLHYMKHIVALAPRGYMLYNNLTQINHFSLQEFVQYLKDMGRKVKVLFQQAPTLGHSVIWHP